jgi:hypothetical protein
MRKLLFAALLSVAAIGQANAQSAVLNWTPPTTRTDGSALAPAQIGVVTIFDTISGTPVAVGTVTGAVGTFTTPTLVPGSMHLYDVVTCDTQSPPVCSAASNVVSYTVPTPPLAAPSAITNLTVTAGP